MASVELRLPPGLRRSNGDPERLNTTGLYRRLLGYVLPYRRVFALSIVGMVVVAAAETVFAALLKPIMDGGFIERDSEIIQSTPFLLIGIFAARALGAFADQYSIAWVGRQMVFDLRQALFDQMIRLPVTYYDRHPSAELISKLIYDLEQVAEASTTSVRVLVKDSLLCTGLILWMFWLSWQLTLIFLLITPFVAIVVGKAGRRFRSSSEGIQASMGGITHVAKEAFQGHKVIKAYAGYQYENRIFQAANQANRRQSLRKALVASISVPLLILLAGTAVAAIIYIAMTDTITTFVSPGTFISYIGTILLLMGPIKRLARVNEFLQAGLAAAHSIFSVLDLPPEGQGGSMTSQTIRGEVEFRNVTFTYPDTEEPALDQVSFMVPAGSTVALVGASGSGKSTAAALLLGFYLPQRGSVLIDSVPVDEYQLTELRKAVALVPQEAILFQGAVQDNITYGQAQVDNNRLDAVAAATGVSRFATLGNGPGATTMGELGARLSGGERQRVSLARALYRQAAILVLDEATSALDPVSERELKGEIARLASDQSLILIAHRLSLVTNADCIYVFDQGRIVESGTHHALLAEAGHYAALWRSQEAQQPAAGTTDR